MNKTLGEELLTPTRIYAHAIKEICSHYKVKNVIKGIANITGGGMIENIPRIMPEGFAVEINKNKWEIPPIFQIIQKEGNINEEEMYHVFNMGIGTVIVIDKYYANSVLKRLTKIGEKPYVIGQIINGNKEVIIK